jgi:hypothetical protein
MGHLCPRGYPYLNGQVTSAARLQGQLRLVGSHTRFINFHNVTKPHKGLNNATPYEILYQ